MRLLLFIFACFSFAKTHSQSINWAYSFPNPAVQEGITDLASDNINHFAIIGYGNNGISMDPINGNSFFNSFGNFLAVYENTTTPTIKWIKSTTGYAFGLFMDKNSNVYLTGKDNGETYLTKYDSNGNLLWNSSSPIDGNPTEIKVKSNGNIILAGITETQSNPTLTNSQKVTVNPGIYFLEFSSSGTLLGAYNIEKIDGNTNVSVFDMTIDIYDNIYICGQLDGQLDFDPTSVQNFNLSTNSYDAFVCKLSHNFNLSWFKTFGDTNQPKGWDKARSVKVDKLLNVYIGGEFTWKTTFDDGSNPIFTLTSDDNSQVPSGYILKYDTKGDLKWVNKIGNINSNSYSDYASISVKDMILSENDIIAFLEGYGVVDMNPNSISNAYETNGIASSNSIFIGQYLHSGDYLSSFSIGSSETMSNTVGVGIESLSDGNIVLSGTFQKKVDFDPSVKESILQCQQGNFYSFDNDIYISSYKLDEALSVSEIKTNYQPNVFPNPFIDELNFDINYNKISLYSLNGKLILQAENIQKLNTSTIEKGSYLIKTEIGSEVTTFKLVK